VNFVDHGAPGLLAFPSEELYADDLIKALRKMAVNRQFAQVRRAEIIMAKNSSAKVCQGEWNFVHYSSVELIIYVCVTIRQCFVFQILSLHCNIL
jgi:Peptidase C13 family.